MTYELNLQDKPFNQIKDGLKTIEMRLNEPKRQAIKVDDTLKLINQNTGEYLLAVVTKIYQFKDFKTLYQNIDKSELGYKIDEVANPDDMLSYYPLEKIEKYGVLGFKIKLIIK